MLKQVFRDFHREESGQDLLEYGLVLATVLVAVVVGSNDIAGVIASAITTLSGRILSIVS
jgi:Flp pilus assembly pilin Flp